MKINQFYMKINQYYNPVNIETKWFDEQCNIINKIVPDISQRLISIVYSSQLDIFEKKYTLKRIVDALLANKSFDNCNNIDDIINVCKACEIEKLLGIKNH